MSSLTDLEKQKLWQEIYCQRHDRQCAEDQIARDAKNKLRLVKNNG